MSKRRGAILLLVFTSLVVYMVGWGWRHFVLVPFGETTLAAVDAVHQPPPWRLREADVEVSYGFVHGRKVYLGKDTVAPARRPAVGQQIRVRYWPRRPSVNRVASEVSTTPIVGAAIGLYGIYASIRNTRWRDPPRLGGEEPET